MVMIQIGEQSYSENELATLAKAGVLQVGQKHDPNSTSLGNTPSLHGPLPSNSNYGGTFTQPGVRPDMFSAVPRERSFMQALSLNTSDYYNEILEIATGVTAGSGSNSSGWCDPSAPMAGFLKTCSQTTTWGQVRLKTWLQSVPDAGQLQTRADVPREILNAGPQSNPLIPSDMWELRDSRNPMQYALYALGFELSRGMEYVAYNGNGALSSANTRRGFMKEFYGVDSMVKTGYTDSKTGVACPAADSIVHDWSTNIGGTDANGNSFAYVVSDMVYAARDRASQVGMEGVEWGFVGRKELFRAITDVWANTYATSRFTLGTAANPLMQTAGEVNNYRLSMLNSQSLEVEGTYFPFLFTEGAQIVKIGGNVYEADLLFLPIRWMGRPLLRLEFFNVDNPYAQELRGFTQAEDYRSLNGGMYLMTKARTPFCVEYHLAAQMRLFLETPFLAGRIDNVRFSYSAQTRNSDPAETYFYSNGGQTYRASSGI